MLIYRNTVSHSQLRYAVEPVTYGGERPLLTKRIAMVNALVTHKHITQLTDALGTALLDMKNWAVRLCPSAFREIKRMWEAYCGIRDMLAATYPYELDSVDNVPFLQKSVTSCSIPLNTLQSKVMLVLDKSSFYQSIHRDKNLSPIFPDVQSVREYFYRVGGIFQEIRGKVQSLEYFLRTTEQRFQLCDDDGLVYDYPWPDDIDVSDVAELLCWEPDIKWSKLHETYPQLLERLHILADALEETGLADKIIKQYGSELNTM